LPKIAGRDGERDRPRGGAERNSGGKVIDGLGGDPRPVDRIHRREIEHIPQTGVGEQGFDEILAVVECAFDREGMNIGRRDHRHLSALHLGYAFMRIKDEYVDRLPAAACLDCSGAGVARGGADDRHMLAPSGHRSIEQAADKL
jgi:hypothetical protein